MWKGLVKTSELSKPRKCCTSGCAAVHAISSQALTSLLAVGLLTAAPLLLVFFFFVGVLVFLGVSYMSNHS